eukprot:TRINITY_DN38268_c0_g1_i3.p1 TRINITY_DN38268_c0_g1~~TRINITY_DN38268_c0_g1_i3.p1  ORF type:complete len:944 (-),score=235.32 TRINITY_DN38268_c0_g1_i3:595-3426(-)
MSEWHRRSSRLLEGLDDSGFQPHFHASGKECGACLLELDPGYLEPHEDFACTLDCCTPRHTFHASCIFTWKQQENSCPLCKQRFVRIGIYGREGNLLRVARTDERDQDFENAEVSSAEGSDEGEDLICMVCRKAGQDHALLLCDGKQGTCSNASHYFCIGLPAVPSGDWFCPDCQPASVLKKQEEDLKTADDALPPKAADGPQATSLEATSALKKESAAAASKEAHSEDKPALKQVPKAERSLACQGTVAAKAKGSAKAAASASAADPKREVGQPSRALGKSVGKAAGKAKKKPKQLLPPADFGGLCKEMPRWISRRGRLLHVDLGGRGIRDAAAALFGKVITGALAHAASRVGPEDDEFAVCVQLAGNNLHKSGLEALLESVSSAGVRVAKLHLERNRLDGAAAAWLGSWLEKLPRGPPDEVYLGGNKIDAKGARALLLALGGASSRALQSGRRSHPVWVEAQDNRIQNPTSLLDAVAGELEVCLAIDRSSCGLRKCESGDASCLHLPGLLQQRSDRPSISQVSSPLKQEQVQGQNPSGATPVKVKKEPGTAALASAQGPIKREEKVCVKKEVPARAPADEADSPLSEAASVDGFVIDVTDSEEEAAGADSAQATAHSQSPTVDREASRLKAATAAEARATAQAQRGIGNLRRLKSLPAAAGSSPAASSGSGPARPSLGREVPVPGSGPQASTAAAPPHRLLAASQPSQPAVAPSPMASQSSQVVAGHAMVHRFDPASLQPPAPAVPAAEAQRQRDERQEWAQGLGKRKFVEVSGYDTLPQQSERPGFSIWDLAKRKLTKKERRERMLRAQVVPKPPEEPTDAVALRAKAEAAKIASLVSASSVPLGPSLTPVVKDVPELLDFIGGKLHRWGRCLWASVSERKLRKKCLQDRLYRLAQLKFYNAMIESGSWQQFLDGGSGRQQVAHFVDETVREHCAKEALG